MATPALAAPLFACLLRLAVLDADVGVRAEGRATTIAAPELPDRTRGSVYTEPYATVSADASRLRLAATYAPRLWSSDLALRASPFVDHVASARLQTREGGAWRAFVNVRGARGTTDPLEDPWRPDALRRDQVATSEPYDFEDLAASAEAGWRAGRTALDAAARYGLSRGADAIARALLPPQRSGSIAGSLTRFATDRDTLRLEARTRLGITEVPAGETRTETATGLATWRRRMPFPLELWVAGGATWASYSDGTARAASELLPEAEIGLARRGADVLVTGELAARLTTAMDRFDGELSSAAEAVGSLGWRPAPRLSVLAWLSGRTRLDGETALGQSGVRTRWMLREFVALELGATASLQHERRPELPSFTEGALLAALTWTLRERLALDVGLTGRAHDEERTETRVGTRSFVEGAAFVRVAYGTSRVFGAERAGSQRSRDDEGGAAGAAGTPTPADE